jgi:hypothetical protein
MGERRGPQSWSFLSHTFVAPAFDDGDACFHPVRLQNEGTAWFRSVSLVRTAK